MVLSESENLGYGSTAKQEPPPQILESDQEDQSLNKDLQLSPLGGQNSLMSLTLNEIQLKSGKNFGSMNMDEFLANLWTNVDDNSNQLVPTATPNQTTEAAVAAATTTSNEPPTLARQGSFSIPAPLCKKTVDEVWYEIQKDQPQQQQTQQSNNNIGAHGHPLKQQTTFGEMTLEDFLVKAGVVQEAPPSSGQHHSNNNNNRILTSYQNPNSSLDSSFTLGQLMGLGLPSPHNGGNNSFSLYHHMFPNRGYNVGEETSNAEAKNDHKGQEDLNDMNAQQNKNKRIIDGPLEVVVERRQRRMIKNRESAARSRARKQAYTVELELELNQLKEENAKLKLIVEEIERKRKDEVMKRKAPTILTQKKVDRLRAIRRTVSLAW